MAASETPGCGGIAGVRGRSAEGPWETRGASLRICALRHRYKDVATIWAPHDYPVPSGVVPTVVGWAGQTSLTSWVKASVEPGAIVHTDGWTGYGKLASAGFDHRPRPQRRDHPDAQKLLPRAHRAVSNLKTWLRGTHRGVSPEHLPVYLDDSSSGTTAAAPRWPRSRRG